MGLKDLQQEFITTLQKHYPAAEAENIWFLVMEHLTEIDFRKNHHQPFEPDGCFVDMITTIRKRLLKSEPVQYILNEAWFYDIPFYVDKNVLIPRPETEELVEWVIKENQGKETLTILDIGTGSGCIPIILKRKLPQAAVYSCDISEAAIEVAKKNARKHKTEIGFLELDILDQKSWEQLPDADIIISNPPYIPEADKKSMRDNVLLYEPETALFVKDGNPLLFYDTIAWLGKEKLNAGRSLYVEIHEKLGTQVVQSFQANGYRAEVKKDMQGKDRMVKGTPIPIAIGT